MTVCAELARGWIGRSKHTEAAVAGTEKKVAVITGASQSISAAMVKAYRDRNYRMVATARSVKPSNDADILVVAGVSPTGRRLDVQEEVPDEVVQLKRKNARSHHAIFEGRCAQPTAKLTRRSLIWVKSGSHGSP
jgi:NAD(P)-dependent dehydrogenase (short-subunit alcohol dehydrogenase family)